MALGRFAGKRGAPENAIAMWVWGREPMRRSEVGAPSNSADPTSAGSRRAGNTFQGWKQTETAWKQFSQTSKSFSA